MWANQVSGMFDIVIMKHAWIFGGRGSDDWRKWGIGKKEIEGDGVMPKKRDAEMG